MNQQKSVLTYVQQVLMEMDILLTLILANVYFNAKLLVNIEIPLMLVVANLIVFQAHTKTQQL